MSHSSPAAYLVWTLITAILGVFLLFHLWSFDRFKCLKWNSGAHSGAFKRVMTYSYLITVPLIFVYALGNAIIKYHEGFVDLPDHGIVPRPYQLWEPEAQRTIFPLMLCFSVGWSLEMVTHLEELCFWLFLVNSGSSQQNWFQSLYFKTWVIGSTLAVSYMPLVTILTRSDPLKSEAFTFLAGSLGSLTLTLWFTPILWSFPTFLDNLRAEGVDASTIVRLTKFSELNTIRVVFRFLFTVPLLILGVDGIRPHVHVNESMLWVDFLTFLAGFGCAISSAITLVIFFPRSVEGEIASRDAARERKKTRSSRTRSSSGASQNPPTHSQLPVTPQPLSPIPHSAAGTTYFIHTSPVRTSAEFHGFEADRDDIPMYGVHSGGYKENLGAQWDDEARDHVGRELPPIRPLRKVRPDDKRDLERGNDILTARNLNTHTRRVGKVNPMVSNFTSPIDFVYTAASDEPKFTFARPH